MNPTNPIPIACTLSDPEIAKRSAEVRQELFVNALGRAETDSGFSYRFPGDASTKTTIHAFIAFERECCRFLRFEVTLEPDLGPIRLTLSGGEGVKDFISQVFDIPRKP